MRYTSEQVREAVDIVIGDDGFRSEEVIQILKTITQENICFSQKEKEKEQRVNKYVVMAKYKSSNNFYIEEQFDKLSNADTYVSLMQDKNDKANLEYFLFEQSRDYNYDEPVKTI